MSKNSFSTYTALNAREKRVVKWSVSFRIFMVLLDLLGVAMLGMAASLASGAALNSDSVTSKFLELINPTGMPSPYLLVLLVAVLFFVAKGLISVSLNNRLSNFLAQIEVEKTSQIFKAMLSANLDKLDRLTTAQVTHGLMGSAQMAFSSSLSAYATIISEGFLIAAILILLATVNPLAFGIFALYFGLVGTVMFFSVFRRIKKVSEEIASSSIATHSLISDSLQSFRQISVLGKVQGLSTSFLISRSKLALANARLGNYSILPRYVTEVALMVGVGGFAALKIAMPELITPSTIAIFVAAGFRIVGSMLPLQGALGLLSQVRDGARFALELKHVFLDQPSSEETQDFADEGGALIEMRNVDFRYEGQLASSLVDLNLKIAKGDCVAVLGRSGAGKSTFADLVLGLRKPTGGQISIMGSSPQRFRNANPGKVAYVPQETSLLTANLRDNVLLEFGASDSRDQEILNLFQELDLLSVVKELPHGLDTEMGILTGNLSGGQVQRIGLARALITKPLILVMDEATSSQDVVTERLIHKALRRRSSSMTQIVIAHRPAILAEARKFILFESGACRIFDSRDSLEKYVGQTELRSILRNDRGQKLG